MYCQIEILGSYYRRNFSRTKGRLLQDSELREALTPATATSIPTVELGMSWTLMSVTSRRKADRNVDRNSGNFLTSKSCFTLDCNLLNIGYTNNVKNTFIHIHSCLLLVHSLTSHLNGTLFIH